MPFMVMANGRQTHLDQADLQDVPIEVFAHHLSTINRFTGAACRPYSVAEHSLLVVEVMERCMCIHYPDVLMGALMHDGEEAVTNDLSTPAKEMVGPAWKAFATPWANAVAERFGLVDVMASYQGVIHFADTVALAIERDQLLPHMQPDGTPLSPWPVLSRITTPPTWINLMDPGRVSLTWQDWRDAFIAKYQELDFGRQAMAERGAA